MRRTTIRTAAALGAAVLITACGDSGSSPSSSPQVNFNLATRAAPAGASAASLAAVGTPEQFTDGAGNVLVIEQVQLVLREIELKRVETTTTCGEAVSGEACEKLEAGPLLLDLPLGGAGGAARTFSVAVDTGTFNEIEFDIHKPEGSDDAAFIQAHPDFDGVSVKVTGTYNGTAFNYVTDLDSEEEIELDPPLVVAAASATDLTLFVDLNGWFRDGAGDLLDPASATSGGPNEGLVTNNIKRTLRAFEDENRDGTDDHAE